MENKLYQIALAALFILAAILIYFILLTRIDKLRAECDRYMANTETLLSDVEQYRVRDSLNAARVQSLELTVKEFERFRAEDDVLIKSLQTKNSDLASVNKTQSETIINLQSVPKDTVIVTKDSLIVPAVKIHSGDTWYDFDGLLTKEKFTGTLRNRDSLVVAETVKYKRFLGFLWKTKQIKDRQVDVVSKNPHTEILGVEHITISK
jgi:hypothetical protein